jgi:hypothetical protein
MPSDQDWVDRLIADKDKGKSLPVVQGKEAWIDELVKQPAKPEVPSKIMGTKRYGVSTGISAAPPEPSMFGEALKISPAKPESSFIQRAIDTVVGMFGETAPSTKFIQGVPVRLEGTKKLEFDTNQLSEIAKARATVQLMARMKGLPLSEYRQSPELIEQAAGEFVSMTTFGMAPAIREALTGETDFPATSVGGYVGGALGSLAGLVLGPATAAEAGISATLKGLSKVGKLSKILPKALPRATTNIDRKSVV